MARPNLERIPATGDWLGRSTLERAPAVVDQAFVDSLTEAEVRSMGRYGVRAATVALRERDPGLLADALFGLVLAATARHDDWRDLMVGMAIHFWVAGQLGVEPPELFGGVADRVPDTSVAEIVRTFGGRTDVTLEVFGWRLVDTPDGPDLALR
jgi:hypothetical protein